MVSSNEPYMPTLTVVVGGEIDGDLSPKAFLILGASVAISSLNVYSTEKTDHND
jgi:hypothetical protein